MVDEHLEEMDHTDQGLEIEICTGSLRKFKTVEV